VRSQIELLAEVQVIDQSLRVKTLELAEGEGRVASLTEATRAQTTAATTARAEHEVLTARQRELETKLGAAESKLKDRRMRLTRIRNDKELGLAKREMEILKDEASTLETELVGVMEQAETTGAKADGLEAELAKLTAERDREAADLKEKTGRLTGDIERERAARAELAKTLEEDLRRRYEMIFSRRGGLAVVEVRGGICLGCRMHVPPQLFNEIQRNLERVFVCPSCQRILYFRAEAAQANG
jgi:predicted  nucleic acid-binding Zn-ribbon protein